MGLRWRLKIPPGFPRSAEPQSLRGRTSMEPSKKPQTPEPEPAGNDGERQTHGFQAEVRELLKLMIHSLYSHREIFLRELISNASDACDRVRFAAIADSALLAEDPELGI